MKNEFLGDEKKRENEWISFGDKRKQTLFKDEMADR